MAAADEKEKKEKAPKAPKARKEPVANKERFNIIEYFKSPSFLVLIIFIIMMVVGGVVVYM